MHGVANGRIDFVPIPQCDVMVKFKLKVLIPVGPVNDGATWLNHGHTCRLLCKHLALVAHA